MQTISLPSLALAFVPTGGVLLLMWRWRLGAGGALYANVRMLIQLLAIGYVLTYLFDADRPLVVAGVVAVMIGVSAWIALRPLESRDARSYLTSLIAIGVSGVVMLALVTQVVLDMPSWFAPRIVIPIAGMIFANTMNTVALAAERYAAEMEGDDADPALARNTAMQAALIPQINSLLAVGLVSLPGMMTGQILSGVDPLVAVRYQIMVMCMIFGAAGSGAATYLVLAARRA